MNQTHTEDLSCHIDLDTGNIIFTRLDDVPPGKNIVYNIFHPATHLGYDTYWNSNLPFCDNLDEWFAEGN